MDDSFIASTVTIAKIISSIDFYAPFSMIQTIDASNCKDVLDSFIKQMQNYPHYEFLGVMELEQLKHFIDVFIIYYSKFDYMQDFMIFLAKFKDSVDMYENELKSGVMTNYKYNLIYINDYILKFDVVFNQAIQNASINSATLCYQPFDIVHISPVKLFKNYKPNQHLKCVLYIPHNADMIHPPCLQYYYIAVAMHGSGASKYLLLKEYEIEQLWTMKKMSLTRRTIIDNMEVYLSDG